MLISLVTWSLNTTDLIGYLGEVLGTELLETYLQTATDKFDHKEEVVKAEVWSLILQFDHHDSPVLVY